MYNPTKFVQYKDLPNINHLVRRGALNQFDVPITINGLTIKTNGQIVGIPKNIENNISIVGNVGAGLDVLHTFSLNANSLFSDKDTVSVLYNGSFATNNNTKRIQVEFDSQVIFNSGARDIDIGYAWTIYLDYIRLTSTTVRASGFALLGLVISGTDGALDTGNSRWFYQAILSAVTVANLNSNAVALRVLAEGTANDDIQCHRSRIDLCQNI